MTLCRNVQDVAYQPIVQCFNQLYDYVLHNGRSAVPEEPRCAESSARLLEPSFLLSYCAAARIGMCALRKRRTWSIVRCLSSSGSFHG
jgi:hypothetical protein